MLEVKVKSLPVGDLGGVSGRRKKLSWPYVVVVFEGPDPDPEPEPEPEPEPKSRSNSGVRGRSSERCVMMPREKGRGWVSKPDLKSGQVR